MISHSDLGQRRKEVNVECLRTTVKVRSHSLLIWFTFKRASSFLIISTLLSAMTVAAFAGITVTSPTNGSTVQSPVKFVASATATGRSRITGMAILVDSVQVYSNRSASLNTSVAISSGTHSIIVRATISTGGSYSANLTITVQASSPPPLTITTTTLASGTVGSAYSATLQATGGTTPYTWSVASGALPSGLTLSTSGIISGTPATSGTSSFSVMVKDAESTPMTATSTFSLTIAPPATLTLTTSSFANGTVGIAYSATLQATGGITPYTWSLTSGSLPSGLTLSASGTISGTPTVSGTSSFSVTVKDAESTPMTATSTFTLTIASPATLTLTTSSLANGTVGIAYSATLQATGGITPYTWSLTSGSLPSGLTLSTSGTISGTPTVSGTSSFSVSVNDSETPPQTVTSGSLTITVIETASLAMAYAAFSAANYTSNSNYTVTNTYYVSPTGSDSNTGTTTLPWATLTHAALTVSGCALVLVDPGTYSVSTSRVAKITNSGTSSCHTAYVATAYSSSYLVAANNHANDPAIWITGSYVDLVGFDITNPQGCLGVYPNGTYTNLYYNRIHDIDNGSRAYSCGSGVGGGGIVGEIGTSTYNNWSENIIWNVGPSGNHYTHGIYTAAPYGTIQNNVVYNASAGCIQAYHQPSNSLISNNTLVGCYWGYIVGADSGYSVSNMVFNDNIVSNNTQYGVYECGAASCGVAMGSNNTYSNNITYSNTGGNQMEGGTLVNNLTSNPELVNVTSPASGGNFAVQSASPAIGAGTTSGASSADILDEARGSVTIGAYQE